MSFDKESANMITMINEFISNLLHQSQQENVDDILQLLAVEDANDYKSDETYIIDNTWFSFRNAVVDDRLDIDGCTDGSIDGCVDGCMDGNAVGAKVGSNDGSTVGSIVVCESFCMFV